MTKAIPAILVLALVSLVALSAALPSALSQAVSTQAKPNIPRTLLGKPYRTRWDSQGCPSSRWTLVVIDCNSDADPEPNHASARQTPPGNSSWLQMKTDRKPRVPIPLPLVLNTFPEFEPARLRLTKSKRPMQSNPCVDDAPPSEIVRSDGMDPWDEDQQRVQFPVISISGPESKLPPHKVSVPVRSKRLYDRGEWKSRLYAEY